MVGSSNLSGRAKYFKKLNHLAVIEFFCFGDAVNTSAQQIRDSFDKVHDQIDNGAKPEYEAEADSVDAALTRLEGAQLAG